MKLEGFRFIYNTTDSLKLDFYNFTFKRTVATE